MVKNLDKIIGLINLDFYVPLRLRVRFLTTTL